MHDPVLALLLRDPELAFIEKVEDFFDGVAHNAFRVGRNFRRVLVGAVDEGL
jgi:hypothetical protein